FVKDERTTSASLSAPPEGLAASARRVRRTPRTVYGAAQVRRYAETPVVRRYDALGIMLGDVHHDGLRRLAQQPQVRYVGSALNVSLIRPVETRDARLSA